MGILPLVLAPFTKDGAAVVLGLELVIAGVYFLGRRLSARSVHR